MPRVILTLLMLFLAACSGNPPAPVEERATRSDRTAPPVSSSSKRYQVQRGDTLYAIAFRYGLDYRQLAAANRIPAPYTIYPGQELYLREAPIPRKPPITTAQKEDEAPAVKKPASTKPAPATVDTYTGSPVSRWRWPAEGRVTRGYSASVHKGIDIGGERGDAVVAAAAGKVVYAGNGIVGLGELVIVKHNEVYLSAYAHNDRLLVAEGDVLQAGQRIALKGSSGTDTVKLHFEIRKEGKPIDPQRVLPRR